MVLVPTQFPECDAQQAGAGGGEAAEIADSCPQGDRVRNNLLNCSTGRVILEVSPK